MNPAEIVFRNTLAPSAMESALTIVAESASMTKPIPTGISKSVVPNWTWIIAVIIIVLFIGAVLYQSSREELGIATERG